MSGLEAERRARERFVVRLGVALHRYGASVPRVEDELGAVSAALGCDGQFFVTPTSILASFGRIGEQRTAMVRVVPSDADLASLTAVEAISREVLAGRLHPERGTERLERLIDERRRLGFGIELLSFAAVGGSAAVLLGGGGSDAGAAALVSLAVAGVARVPGLGGAMPTVAALLAAAGAALASRVPGVSAAVVTLASLIVFLPGFSVTLATSELASGHLAAGSARMAGALTTFVQIGLGVAVGRRLFPAEAAAAALGPEWLEPAAVLVAALGFAALFRAARRDVVWVVLACVLAWLSSRLGRATVGSELGPFLAAAAVGVAANGFSRLLDRPVAIVGTPGTLLLVPGSVGYRSLAYFLDDDVVSAVDTAFSMTLTAVAIAAGLLFAGLLVPSRSLTGRVAPGLRR